MKLQAVVKVVPATDDFERQAVVGAQPKAKPRPVFALIPYAVVAGTRVDAPCVRHQRGAGGFKLFRRENPGVARVHVRVAYADKLAARPQHLRGRLR